MSPSLRQALWQTPTLILLAVIFAVCVNGLRADPILLLEDWSIETRFADAAESSLIIPLGRAWELFENGAVLFVDARLPDEYAKGHIYGALNLPWQAVDHYFAEAAQRLEGPQTIVAYCDGEGCDLSHELALFLLAMGFERVRVLDNGWPLWQAAGLPTAVDG